MPARFDAETIATLNALAQIYPDADAVVARLAQLSAQLTLPKGTVHIVSDVHGEHKKLKHVINNASGTLRALVDEVFGGRLPPESKLELLNTIYYPREAFAHYAAADARPWVELFVRRATELLRVLSRHFTLDQVEAVLPSAQRWMFREALLERELQREAAFFASIVDRFFAAKEELELVRHFAHAVRNLLVSELIVAGDLGDRGPRIDKVIEHVFRQPKVSLAWGNHDAVWMAACLGDRASIATVLRNSIRYRRLSQIEEGYGIPMAPVEKLARTIYSDDPAAQWGVKGEGLRDPVLMARMQKAIAVIQFKLEGQLAERNPHLGLDNRNVLKMIDFSRRTVRLDGVEGKDHPLLDGFFPTIDPADPLRLTKEETACLDRLAESFFFSPTLWRHMQLVAAHGSTYLLRDNNVIFHGCVPVDASGRFLSVTLDGAERAGRELFDTLNTIVQRAFRTKRPADLDVLYWMWAGARSPLFGKDKMTTFERYLIADEATHKETKNPYFKLIHEPEFCARIFREFGIDGIDDRFGMIVNGHVPVKMEAGESPVKKSGMAVTIDGAFSEAYGDRGYSLVLDSERTYVAEHHHFDSVASAIETGADIIPTLSVIQSHERTRRVADTEEGSRIRAEISVLEKLLEALRQNLIRHQ